jgi:hypothetical protein
MPKAPEVFYIFDERGRQKFKMSLAELKMFVSTIPANRLAQIKFQAEGRPGWFPLSEVPEMKDILREVVALQPEDAESTIIALQTLTNADSVSLVSSTQPIVPGGRIDRRRPSSPMRSTAPMPPAAPQAKQPIDQPIPAAPKKPEPPFKPSARAPQTNDRRKSARVVVRQRVIVLWEQSVYRTFTVDASLDGLRLEHPIPKELIGRTVEGYLSSRDLRTGLFFRAQLVDERDLVRLRFIDQQAENRKILALWLAELSRRSA